MEEQLIEFKTAKLAKEKGFNIPCDGRWWIEPASDWKFSKQGVIKCDNYGDSISSPTQSLLQKWLREVHNILVLVDFDKDKNSNGIVYTVSWDKVVGSNTGWYSDKTFSSYEEALEIGLQESLKLL